MPQRIIRAGEIERALANVYSALYNRIKADPLFPWNMVDIKTKYNEDVYSRTRKAVTAVYTTGIDYVGYKTNSDTYPGDTDLANIKTVTDKAVVSFWYKIGEDAKRNREQELEVEGKQQDRATTKLLKSTATVAVTTGLALSTISKSRQVLNESSDLVDTTEKPRMKWTTAMDEKVCPICSRLDGQTWEYDDPSIPVPGQLGPSGTHPNCRCYLDLITSGSDLG